MTSRRSISQHDQRLSRALQFEPGHAGGRVASAQPVERRDGTLRRESVGAAGAPAADLCVVYPPPFTPYFEGGNYLEGPPNALPDADSDTPEHPVTVYVTVAESPAAVWVRLYAIDSADQTVPATLVDGVWVASFPTWPVMYTDVLVFDNNTHAGPTLTMTHLRICPL